MGELVRYPLGRHSQSRPWSPRSVRASCLSAPSSARRLTRTACFCHAILPIAALARMLRHHRLLGDLRCSLLDEWFRLPIRGTSTPSTEPHQLTSQTQIATVAR